MALPTPSVCAAPRLPAALLIVAIEVSELLQVAALVTSWVLLSENVAVAANCWPTPFGTDGLVGVTAIERSTAAVTVSVAVPVTLPELAAMVVVPAALPLARPAALIVALPGSDETQATLPLRSSRELSE